LAVELSLDVPRSRRGPEIARHVVRERFRNELTPQQLDNLLLIVSELTSNALIHGRGEIRLRISLDAGRVRGEVIDQGSGLEVEMRRRGAEEVGGRGLDLVASLADQWGVHEGTSHVWFEVGPDSGASEAAEPDLGVDARPDELD
jgi:anti-sigma regulatory factor (Ser/Thr protein kinase)